jgi:IS605 OrfB family transposase
MQIRRSSKTSLKFATSKKREVLAKILAEYSRVVNFFMEYLWDKNLTASDLKKEIINLPETWLSARMRQCAAREALAMIQAARMAAKAKGEPPLKPVHRGKKMTLSSQVVRIEEGCNSFDLWLVLHSVGENLKLYLPLRRHRHMNLFRDWTMAQSVVIHQDYVQLTFSTETGPKRAEGELVGIDLGMNHLLATSTGELMGSEIRHLIQVIKRRKPGSKGQKRARKTLSYYIHKVIKDFFLTHSDLRLVVVEQLKGLKQGKKPDRSKEYRRTLSNWNYREALDIIQLRTEENRVSFRSVGPRKTSQQCPILRCSHTERENRQGEKFCCLRCGYSGHADLVAAQNILRRFTSGRYGAAFQS